ncbi:MAG: hypothetical protein M1819_005976 [Sarea resinae]|nr:MAG: hypothetical protein M1819_005976 [Sarea resinae]
MNPGRFAAPPPRVNQPAAALRKPVELNRDVCLRCAKVIGSTPDIVCTKASSAAKCTRCARLHKKCSQVPTVFRKRLNRLTKAADVVVGYADDNPAKEPSAAALRDLQRRFTRQVEVHVNAANKHPSDNALRTAVATERLADGVESLNDILRFAFDLPSVTRAGESDDEDDDDTTAPPGGSGNQASQGQAGQTGQ